MIIDSNLLFFFFFRFRKDCFETNSCVCQKFSIHKEYVNCNLNLFDVVDWYVDINIILD